MPRDHDYWVYMTSNKTRSTLYISVTNDLLCRVANIVAERFQVSLAIITALVSSIANTSVTFATRLPEKSS